MAADIILTAQAAVATITLNRPDKRNAIAQAQWQALPGLIAQACANPATRVIVLCGAGGHFAAGADIAEFGEVFASREATTAYLAAMSAATRAIEHAPLPVIAQIDGLCIGAGVALAAACDLRLAASDARFAITPAKLGLVYSLADTARVTALIGPAVIKDLLFTARLIDADEAHRVGLVNALHAPADLAAAVADKAAMIAALSPWSHAHGKQVVQRVVAGARDDDAQTRGWFADAPQGADFREGTAAFAQRRKPEF